MQVYFLKLPIYSLMFSFKFSGCLKKKSFYAETQIFEIVWDSYMKSVKLNKKNVLCCSLDCTSDLS